MEVALAQVRVSECLAMMMPIIYEQYNLPYLQIWEMRLGPETWILNNSVTACPASSVA
jgi:hypothetical protein